MSAPTQRAEWPECETVEVLEARDARRRLIADITGGIVSLAAVLGTWQGLVWYSVAIYAA